MDGEHTHGPGGHKRMVPGWALVACGALAVVALGGGISTMMSAVLMVAGITLGAVGLIAVAGLLGWLAMRARRPAEPLWGQERPSVWEQSHQRQFTPPAGGRMTRGYPAPPVEGGQHLHLHFHGASPQERAEILRRAINGQ